MKLQLTVLTQMLHMINYVRCHCFYFLNFIFFLSIICISTLGFGEYKCETLLILNKNLDQGHPRYSDDLKGPLSLFSPLKRTELHTQLSIDSITLEDLTENIDLFARLIQRFPVKNIKFLSPFFSSHFPKGKEVIMPYANFDKLSWAFLFQDIPTVKAHIQSYGPHLNRSYYPYNLISLLNKMHGYTPSELEQLLFPLYSNYLSQTKHCDQSIPGTIPSKRLADMAISIITESSFHLNPSFPKSIIDRYQNYLDSVGRLINSHLLNPHTKNARNLTAIFSLIQRELLKIFPFNKKVSLILFGSTINGRGTVDSDLDAVLRVKDSGLWEPLLSGLQVEKLKSLLSNFFHTQTVHLDDFNDRVDILNLGLELNNLVIEINQDGVFFIYNDFLEETPPSNDGENSIPEFTSLVKFE